MHDALMKANTTPHQNGLAGRHGFRVLYFIIYYFVDREQRSFSGRNCLSFDPFHFLSASPRPLGNDTPFQPLVIMLRMLPWSVPEGVLSTER